jgi:hypothetical protein
MPSLRSPLHDIRVASPCPASWEQMPGDERVRFCDACALHVYNLSAMTAREAERLVMRNEGRLCVRFYRREDGTVLTQDCPRGLAALRWRARRTTLLFAAALAAMCLLLFGVLGAAVGVRGHGRSKISDVQPFKTVYEWFNGRDDATVGAICPEDVPNTNNEIDPPR